ncbi:MAG: hypothetical protein DMG18_09650 [Acidobacteria bacterium]|nr:MAG: hypothetical protein DMG18_09650 [Acidobacteriota bacterium]
MRLILFIAIVILTGTAGDLAVSHAMKQIGHVSPITPSAIFRFLALAFQMVWLWIGIALMATGFFSLLALRSGDGPELRRRRVGGEVSPE